MKAGELKKIVELIEEKEDLSLSEIATKARVDRSYLSKVLNGDTQKEMTELLIRRLTRPFPSYFYEVTENNENNNAGAENPIDDTNDINALIRSNKALADAALIQAQAAKIRAESDRIIAKNVEDLISLAKVSTASDVVSTQKETVATVKALKEHLFELESQVTKKSVREIKQAFHNKVKQVKDPV